MRTTEDLIEQCAAAVHFCRDDADAHEIANAVLAIALEEAAKVAEGEAQKFAADDEGLDSTDAAMIIASRLRSLAHTTGQEGGR